MTSTVADHDGKFVARGSTLETVMGNRNPPRIALLESGSLDPVHAWLDFAAFKALDDIRTRSSNINMVIAAPTRPDLHNPDFVQFTESFGAVGMRGNDPEDLATLIPEALALQRPVVIDVPFRRDAHTPSPLLRPPMDPTPRRPHPLLGGLPVMPSRHTTRLSGLALT